MTIIHARVDESAFVRESATVSVGDLGQAGVKSAHGVTVRVGVAEEYFEGAQGRHKDELRRMKDELSELGKYLLYLCGRNIRLLCL